MIKPENEYVADALAYAEGVLDGTIPACSFVKMACQRFWDDLQRDDLYFDQRAVNVFCMFNETVPHVKGRWARDNQTLILSPWQRFIDANIFGLKRKSDGLRKYNEAYLEVPRKNGKSFRMAALGLYMTVADGERGAETYCLATTEKQAHEVFIPAKSMLSTKPELQAFTKLEVMAKKIVRREDNSHFSPLIGKPHDGASPTCAIIDEYHEHSHDRALRAMQTGLGAREEPLLVIITTAGDNVAGPCFEKREQMVGILRKTVEDESTDAKFGIIYTIDAEGDDNFWKTEDALRMANPNYDVSVAGRWLRTQQLEAVNQIEAQSAFKTKHLNVWVQQSHPWVNMDRWVQCEDEDATLENLSHLPCIVGVDYGSKIDFAAACMVFFDEDEDGRVHYYAVPRFWLPKSRFDKVRDYQKWKDFITVTDTEEVDTLRIKKDLKAMTNQVRVQEVVFDPWRTVGIEQELQIETFVEVVRMGQTIAQYTAPMYEFQAAVQSGRIHYAKNPVLSWMVGNVVAKRDTNDNVKPIRQGYGKKIDGAVAMVEGIARCMAMVDYYDQDFSEVIAA